MFWSTARTGGWIPDHSLAIDSSLISTLPVLQDATFFCSLGWILYRIWQIYQKPVDELVELLGLDIPPVPDVSLGGISSDSVLLYWKPVENHSTSLKNTIQVNGIKGTLHVYDLCESVDVLTPLSVGEINLKDNSIQVTGLKPGHYYNIRVIASNSAGFSTLGALIRLRTVPTRTKDGSDSAKVEESDGDERVEDSEPAGIRPVPSHFGSAVHSPPHHSAKEMAIVQPSSRRAVLGRRLSPATSVTAPSSVLSSRAASVDEDDSDEAIQRLTGQLDRLRREQYETDKQIHDEDREHLTSVADLSRDRDHFRQLLKEKEETTAELGRQRGHLEKTNRSAQSKKATKERILQQKKAERLKIKDDINRWDSEIASMRQEMERMALENEQLTAAKDEDVTEIRKAISRDQNEIKNLEDDIRTWGIQIKFLEETRQSPGGNEDDEQDGANDRTSDGQAWEFRAHSIQVQLANIWHTYQQVEAENQQAQERVAYWTSRRSRDPTHFAALPATDFPFANRPARLQRHRQLGSRSNAGPVLFGGYPGGLPGVPYSSSASTQFSSASPFFNMSNGMAVLEVPASSASGNLNSSLNESEILTGGGPMSPAATDLLPSNLFRDEDSMIQESPTALRHESSRGGSFDWAEFQSVPPVEAPDTERRTPGSADSRRGSLLSSPHGSIRNHHSGHSSGDMFADNDRLSIHSTGASILPNAAPSTNALGTSRLAHIFPTLYRPRGKSSTHEPPALGTLKQGQSQSFPRNMEQDSFDTLERRRRKGNYGNWALPMAGLLNRHGIGTEDSPKESSIPSTANAVGSRNRLNVFGSRGETDGMTGYHERSSSRPSSMYSFDQIYGRPSSDSQRLSGWPVTESTPSRSSPLNAEWSTSGGPWSQVPSRRPSVQRGSTSNLSIGSTPLDSEAFGNVLTPQRSEQLPIGTRPRSSQRFSTPKLNPAAPTFKTIFGRSEARKAAKAEKANEKAVEKERAKDVETAHSEKIASAGEESSLSQPRLSRDAGSITTAGSVAESHDSLDHSMSGTASEAAASSATRESFMQKITRKSSSSKFNVPWGKERGGLFSKKAGEPSTPDEGEEDVPSEGQVPKSGDSVTSTPQVEKGSRSSLSWPNMRRKSKKGGSAVEKGNETADDDEN
ncbi:MAG: hypothetical protein Q9166_003058 [cf. Caloplaca sp. 2 TL-2023]